MESRLVAGLTPVDPTAPPAAYLGGKRNMSRTINDRLGQTPHTTYAEVFVGMAGVFLRRPFKARSEVINDISADVSNLFRILQRHYNPLMDMLRWQVTSRDEFNRLRVANPDTLTDLERAVRFLYLQRLAFSGKVIHRSFTTHPGAPGRFDVQKLQPMLEAVHERLSGVVIERLHYAELIRRWDRADTLFFLDPPYWGLENEYGRDVFERADYERLAEMLAGIQGRFLMTLNDKPGVREAFARFRIEEVEITYGVSKRLGRASTPATELIITDATRPVGG